MPSFYAYHLDGIDLRMILESLQGIEDYRLVEYIQELFGYVLLHPGSRSARYDYRYVHIFTGSLCFQR